MDEQKNTQKTKTLEPDAAIKLWQAGKYEWNKWVSENPEYNISFKNLDFSTFRTEDNSDISFIEFIFPRGKVDFSRATFGKGAVRFVGANFGEGNVDFSEANFGEGNVYFVEATFGKGKVDFSRAKFGKGNVDFNDTTFGEGFVSFGYAAFGKGFVRFDFATFGKGYVSFGEATFDDGIVRFSRANFGEGDVNFHKATFGEGFVSFGYATFGEGDVDFARATFGNGNVDFGGATFGDGKVDFHNTTFGEGKVDFGDAKFTGKFYLEDCQHTEKIKSLTFQNCTFNDAVVIKNITLNCVLDMVNTSFANQISLFGIICRLQRKRNKWGVKIVEDEDDIERLIRLKELTENNRNHEQALMFHADEQRAKRWVKAGNIVSLIDVVFSGICDYGQSIVRPLFLWFLSICIFATPYAYLSEKPVQSLKSVWEIFVFAAFNSVPFLTMARGVRADGVKEFFHDDAMLTYVYPIMGLQGITSIILIFLVGLGLRNRFRI